MLTSRRASSKLSSAATVRKFYFTCPAETSRSSASNISRSYVPATKFPSPQKIEVWCVVWPLKPENLLRSRLAVIPLPRSTAGLAGCPAGERPARAAHSTGAPVLKLPGHGCLGYSTNRNSSSSKSRLAYSVARADWNLLSLAQHGEIRRERRSFPSPFYSVLAPVLPAHKASSNPLAQCSPGHSLEGRKPMPVCCAERRKAMQSPSTQARPWEAPLPTSAGAPLMSLSISPALPGPFTWKPAAIQTPSPEPSPLARARCSERGCVFPASPGTEGKCLHHLRQAQEPVLFSSCQPTRAVLERSRFGVPQAEVDTSRRCDRRRMAAIREAFLED